MLLYTRPSYLSCRLMNHKLDYFNLRQYEKFKALTPYYIAPEPGFTYYF